MAQNSKKTIWMERVGSGSYVGHNSAGASVAIGHGEGEFTPGDLLKLALAGCKATSSDARFAAALGDDYTSMIGVDGDYDEDTNRYVHMVVEIVADHSGLSDQDKEKLEDRVRRAIDRHCTVGHTLNNGMSNDLVVTFED